MKIKSRRTTAKNAFEQDALFALDTNGNVVTNDTEKQETRRGRHRKARRLGNFVRNNVFAEAARAGKDMIKSSIARLRDVMQPLPVSDSQMAKYLADNPDATRRDVKEARDRLQRENNKVRLRLSLGAAAGVLTTGAYVALQYAPFARMQSGIHGVEMLALGQDDGLIVDPMNMEVPADIDPTSGHAQLGHNDYDAARAEQHVTGTTPDYDGDDKNTDPSDLPAGLKDGEVDMNAFHAVDYLFDNPNKQHKNDFGPMPDIMDKFDNPSVGISEQIMESDYKKDPTFTAAHMAHEGLIKRSQIDEVSAVFRKNPEAWEHAVEQIMNERKGDTVRIAKVDGPYASLYQEDKNGDGIPETYYDNRVDHGGLALVYTDKKTGEERWYRIDCHFQPMWKEKNIVEGVPPLHPDTPDTPDTPETPRPPRTPETPHTPEIPEKPEKPETPDTPETPEKPEKPEKPETPDTPETPEKPETPETPETPEEPEQPKTVPKDENESIHKNPNIPEQHKPDKDPVRTPPVTQDPGVGNDTHTNPKPPVVDKAPDATPPPRDSNGDVNHNPGNIKPETGANKPVPETQPEVGGKPENNTGNNGRVDAGDM